MSNETKPQPGDTAPAGTRVGDAGNTEQGRDGNDGRGGGREDGVPGNQQRGPVETKPPKKRLT